MNKIYYLINFFLYILILSNPAFSKEYNLNEVVIGDLEFDKRLNLSLSDGKWTVIGNNKTFKKFPFKSLMLIKVKLNLDCNELK